MARILAVTWDGGGNLPPMLGIARELQRRGHELMVLGHPQQHDAIADAGLKFRPYQYARRWSSRVPATGARFLWRFLFEVFTDPGPGRDVREELARESADVALVDSMLLAAIRAAQRANVITVVLMHTLRRYHTHAWSRGPIGAVATLRGMRPGRLWNAADRVLIATDFALDPSREDRLPANVRYTGVVQSPVQSGVPQEKPLVLVSLSTMFFARQEATLQTIVDALEKLPVRAVVTTGAVDHDVVRAPPNVEVRDFLPHDEIMPSASLVIGHGGHSTTMRALAHGIPLLIFPMHSVLDQEMIGKAVADAGAGLVLSKASSVEEIQRAVRTLLGEPSYRQAARVIAARLGSHDGASAAADEIDGLLKLEHRSVPSAAHAHGNFPAPSGG